MKEKILELKKLMGYFELISVTYGDKHWVLRNRTDEGLGHGTNRVEFFDENPEALIDRAISYAKSGPGKEILKAAEEITSLFKRRTLIQGDVISVLITTLDDLEVESRICEMQWKYGMFGLEPLFIGIEENDEFFK